MKNSFAPRASACSKPRVLAALLSLSLLGAAPTARLVYEVRPGLTACPDEQWVRSAVAGRLGRDPFTTDAPTVVRARIDRAVPGLVALIEVERANGTTGRRSVASPTGDCLELASTVELAITLAIDPLWLTSPKPPPTPEKAAPAPPPAAPPPAQVATPLPVPPPVVEASSAAVSGHVAALLTAGAVPGFTGGLAFGASTRWPLFRLTFEARAHWPTSVVSALGTATVFTALLSALPCLELGRFSACAVASAGVFQVESTAAELRRSTSPIAHAGARGSAGFELTSRVILRPWLEAAVMLTRISIVSGATPLWVTWPVSLTGGCALEVRFSS